MDFSVRMSGGVATGGFAVTSKTVRLPIKFREGDAPYLRYKAIKGVLERVSIRRLRVDVYDKTFGQLYQTYYDQHNSRYNDTELVSRSEAVKLATIYYQRVLNRTEVHIEDLLSG